MKDMLPLWSKHLDCLGEISAASIDPFVMRKEIRRLENEVWSRRKTLYEEKARDDLALSGVPPLRSRTPARVSKPTTKNQTRLSILLEAFKIYAILISQMESYLNHRHPKHQ